jgi:hypothetical protein
MVCLTRWAEALLDVAVAVGDPEDWAEPAPPPQATSSVIAAATASAQAGRRAMLLAGGIRGLHLD